jgi:hypothetical protein
MSLSAVPIYSILVAESYSDNKLSFVEDALLPGEASRAGRTNSETWEPLEKLSKGEVSFPPT